VEGDRLLVRLIEHHRVGDVLKRIFWSPLRLLHGEKLWRLRITEDMPLDTTLLFAVGKVCADGQGHRPQCRLRKNSTPC